MKKFNKYSKQRIYVLYKNSTKEVFFYYVHRFMYKKNIYIIFTYIISLSFCENPQKLCTSYHILSLHFIHNKNQRFPL